MKIEYHNTIDDLIAFNRYTFENNPSAKLVYRFVLFLIPTSMVITAILFVIYLPSWTWFASAILFILAFLWFFDYPKRFWKIMDNNVKKTMESGKIKGVLGKHTVEISERGIQEVTDVNQSFSDWVGIYGIEHNVSYIFVFINPTMAYIIPKNAFPDNNSVASFYSSISSYHAKTSSPTAHRLTAVSTPKGLVARDGQEEDKKEA